MWKAASCYLFIELVGHLLLLKCVAVIGAMVAVSFVARGISFISLTTNNVASSHLQVHTALSSPTACTIKRIFDISISNLSKHCLTLRFFGMHVT